MSRVGIHAPFAVLRNEVSHWTDLSVANGNGVMLRILIVSIAVIWLSMLLATSQEATPPLPPVHADDRKALAEANILIDRVVELYQSEIF